jgi:hypothetical protein
MTDELNSTEAARALVAKKRRTQGVCVVCAKPFTGLARRLYCGHACAERASYLRRRKAKNLPESTWAQAAREFAARERGAQTTPPDTLGLLKYTRGVTISPLVARLDATAAAIARGRTFPDSTPIIRADRQRWPDDT